jgi:hypothetical protein
VTAKRSLTEIGSRVRARLSGLTITGVVVLMVWIAEQVHAAEFWYGIGSRIFPPVYRFMGTTWGGLILIICGIGLIFFDQRRITRRQQKAHDLSTLKGRTLQLRDDIQAFVDSTPKASGYVGASQQGTIERLSSQASFVMGRLEHGYYLHFADRVSHVYHEFGERGVQDKELTRAITEKKYEQVTTYRIIIDALARLAQCPEASADNLNSITPAAFSKEMQLENYRKAREERRPR